MSDIQNPYRPNTQDHVDWEERRQRQRDEEERRFINNFLRENERITHSAIQASDPGNSSWKGRPDEPKPQSGIWYPGVDAWFERNISPALHRWIALFCAILLAAIAGTIASDAGWTEAEVWGAIIAGTLAGLLVLPLLIVAVKLVLFCLTLAVLGAIMWLIYLLIME